MIWLLMPDQSRPTELAPAMDESTGILPGLPAVAGKPVHVAFDGGRMTSDARILSVGGAVVDHLGSSRERLRAAGLYLLTMEVLITRRLDTWTLIQLMPQL